MEAQEPLLCVCACVCYITVNVWMSEWKKKELNEFHRHEMILESMLMPIRPLPI